MMIISIFFFFFELSSRVSARVSYFHSLPGIPGFVHCLAIDRCGRDGTIVGYVFAYELPKEQRVSKIYNRLTEMDRIGLDPMKHYSIMPTQNDRQTKALLIFFSALSSKQHKKNSD